MFRGTLHKLLTLLAFACISACAGLAESPRRTGVLETGSTDKVLGVGAEKLAAPYWIDRLAAPDAAVLDGRQIAEQNARLLRDDPSITDLHRLPDTLDREFVRERILGVSAPRKAALYDAHGDTVPASALVALHDALALERIGKHVTPRFGLVSRRADLRSFPTAQRVFSRIGDTDIDRFQESALFPGTPVAVLHESRDGQWFFVTSLNYSAWIDAEHIAIGKRDKVLDYAARVPYLVVTGAGVRTVFTPERPAVSDLPLDMGVRLPLLGDWPVEQPVNGQFAYASHVVALPVRRADGTLEIVPALVSRSADVRSDGFLPLTRANLIRQAFKLLGERYGWGHSYGGRDCSGLVAEVYRGFGVDMPRNTGDQSRSPAFSRLTLDDVEDKARRRELLLGLDIGDLIYIPGHVVMVIGREDGELWVIHDVTTVHHLDTDGILRTVPLNQVAVTPLFPLRDADGTPWTDRITSIQRIRAPDISQANP